MAVTQKLIAQNVVLVINNINTGVFDKFWFVDNGVFVREEFLQDSIFAPGLSVVSTKDCSLTVLPNQVQLAVKSDDPQVGINCVMQKMSAFIKALSNVRVVAMGMNFTWRVEDREKHINALTRELFDAPQDKLHQYFNHQDARFGTYISQDYDNETRLKLDIKPVNSLEDGVVIDFIMAAFNYHSDVKVQNYQEYLLHLLEKWPLLNSNAEEIICLLK